MSHRVFGLYEMPEFRNIQRLNISQRKINTVTINNTGEWLAFGVSQYGQVLVWEWQSERCKYCLCWLVARCTDAC